jgi:uncharacterized protein (DUF1697 family)
LNVAGEVYVGLLYSIVIGKGIRVTNEALKEIVSDCGYLNPRPYISSGNVVFEAKKQAVSPIELKLEETFQHRFGKKIDIIVKPREEFLDLLSQNPWPRLAAKDGSRIAIKIMREKLSMERAKLLRAALGDGEKLAIIDGHVWYYVPMENGGSPLHAKVSARANGIGTSRNWNTMQGLARLLAQE